MLQLTHFPNYAVRFDDERRICVEASQPQVLRTLAEAGIVLTVAAQRSLQGPNGQLVPLKLPGMRFFELGLVDSRASRWRRALRYMGQIIPVLLAVHRGDVSYIFFPGHVAILAIGACWLLGKPYGLYFRGDFEMATPLLLRPLKGPILRWAQFVLCTGERLTTQVSKCNRRAEPTVPLSPLLFLDYPSVNRPEVGAKPRLLFVGQIVREKGIFELLDAFQQLLGRGFPEMELLYVGDGPQRLTLEDEITLRSLQGRVRCLGSITAPAQLADLYFHSTVFCLPTYFPEGFPRVLYEAMRFALPIVTTPVGQITGVMSHERNCLLCEPHSVPMLTSTLVRLLQSPELQRQLGAGARRTLEPMLVAWGTKTHGHQVLGWLKELGFLDAAQRSAGATTKRSR